MSAQTAAAIRQALKGAGFGVSAVSVRNEQWSTGSSVRVKVKRAQVPLERVRAIAAQFERVDRDHATGEILAGGNTYVSVDYESHALVSEGALAQRQLDEGRRAFGALVVSELDRYTLSVWEAGDDGRHVANIDAQRGGGQLAKLLAERGWLAALEEARTDLPAALAALVEAAEVATMTIPNVPAGVEECEDPDCTGCPGCPQPQCGCVDIGECEVCAPESAPRVSPAPCSEGCPGWCISTNDATGEPAIERCDACWQGIDGAPDDDEYSIWPECQAALVAERRRTAPEEGAEMTIEQVRARVEEIRRQAAQGDDEAAHSLEDALLLAVVQHFAAQGHAIAAEALATQALKFGRHCA